MDTISAEQFARISNLSDQRHRQLAKMGYFPPPIKGQYQMEPALQGIIRYLRDQAAKSENTLEQEKLKKLTAERQLAELLLATKRGEALDAAAVFKTWENMLVTFRQKLLAMPAQLSPRVAFLKTQDEVETALEREVNDYLIDLSKPQNYAETDEEPSEAEGDGPEEIHEGNKPASKPTKAAAKNKRR
tara:strand:- start:113 stop:676 length:564 start_codon:yes stop_codon:yes gene_type:complete